MTKTKAIEICTEQAYKCAKLIGQFKEIRDRLEFVAEQMNWDTMLMMDYDDVMVKLANVMAGTTLWATEEQFKEKELKEFCAPADVFEGVDEIVE